MVDTFVVVGNADEARARVAQFEEFCDAVDLEVPHNFIPDEVHEEYEKRLFEVFAN